MSSGQRRIIPGSASAATPIPRVTPPQSQPGYTEVAKSVLDRLRHGVRRSSSHSTPTDQLAGKPIVTRRYAPTSRQDVTHKTGLKIRALDVNQARTHVVLAGGRILKTVRVDDSPSCAEDFDLRTAAVNLPWNSSTERDLDSNTRFQQEVVDPAALQRETFDIEDVAWSNNEFKDSIATAARNGKIMLYNIRRPGMEIARLHEHLQQVHKVDFNPLEGGVLLSGSQDGTVRLWDLRSLQRSAMLCSSRDTYQGRSHSVRHVKWSPTSTWTFAFSTDNGGVQRWDTRNNRTPLLKLIAHDGYCNTIDWHPDGRHLASGGEDGLVKVWNMAPDEPRSKPTTIIRAPHGVQNLRWRPSCYVQEGSEGGSKECTHLATSYKNYPVVHVWDLRRPYIPFREIHHTHNNGTTDMLWRTRDLLWTVGPEGEFMQTDVPFAPKTIDRRPMSTFARSSTGEVNLYIKKRDPHRGSKNEYKARTPQSDHPSKPQIHVTQETPFARSPGDDSIDERFLGSGRRRRSRTSSFKSTKSTGTTPPSIEDTTKSDTVDLSLTMQDFDNFRPSQTPKIGPLPGARSDLITTYMAQKCKGPPIDSALDLHYVTNIRSLFDQNAVYAQRASRYREAQTWRIVGAQLEKDLRIRATANRQKRISSKPQVDAQVNRAALPSPDPRTELSLLSSAQTNPRTLHIPESTPKMSSPLSNPIYEPDDALDVDELPDTSNDEDEDSKMEDISSDLDDDTPSVAHTHQHPVSLTGGLPRLTYFDFSDPPSTLMLSEELEDNPEWNDFVLADYMTPRAPPQQNDTQYTLDLSTMLEELLQWYTEHGDPRMAAQLFLLAASVLPTPLSHESISADDYETNAFYEHLTSTTLEMSPGLAAEVISSYHARVRAVGLDPGHVESFLSQYHEELVAHNLHNPATMLRRTCYPAFPAVYEQALIHTTIGLLCLECHNPINNHSNRHLCETCGARLAPCCICECTDSPYGPYFGRVKTKATDSPLAAAAGTANPSGTTPGTSVWACCQTCNHSTHIACASAWFVDPESKGACPMQGCLCECIRGGHREERGGLGVDGGGDGRTRAVGRERTVRFLDG